MRNHRTSRKPLGWLAIAGATASGLLGVYQLRLGVLTAFSGSIQVDAFSIFFHLLICAVVIATLLGSLDYFEVHAGEYVRLVLLGAVGMMLMTCSVELLMIFIGLEISSISTYILAGFRKGEGTAVESSIRISFSDRSPHRSSCTALRLPMAQPAPPALPPSPPRLARLLRLEWPFLRSP